MIRSTCDSGCRRGRRFRWRLAVGAGFNLVEQPHLQPLGDAELFAAAAVQLVLVPGHIFDRELGRQDDPDAFNVEAVCELQCQCRFRLEK